MITKLKNNLLLVFLLIPAVSDAKTNPVFATITVGDTPSNIAITPDGKYGYVANNNNDSIANTVSVINLSNNTVSTITNGTFNQPYTITINSAGTLAYVTNSGGSTISIVNIASNTVTSTITGFYLPTGMVITPDGNTAYVNNYGDNTLASGNGNTISVVTNLTTTPAITHTITINSPTPPNAAPAALAITPDGKYVYSANYVDGNPGTGTVSVIDTSSNTIVDTITGFSGPFNIVITPNGKYAYVSNFGSNNFTPVGTTVSAIDLSTNKVIADIYVGVQPAGLAVTPDSRFVYVTVYNTLYLRPSFNGLNAAPGLVYIINTATNQLMTPVITVGYSPGGVAITPDGTRAYVTNYSSDTVSAINIVDRMWLNVCN